MYFGINATRVKCNCNNAQVTNNEKLFYLYGISIRVRKQMGNMLLAKLLYKLSPFSYELDLTKPLYNSNLRRLFSSIYSSESYISHLKSEKVHPIFYLLISYYSHP